MNIIAIIAAVIGVALAANSAIPSGFSTITLGPSGTAVPHTGLIPCPKKPLPHFLGVGPACQPQEDSD